MRTIITDCTAPIEGTQKGDQILIVCGEEASFSPKTVASLLEMNAKLITVPEDSVAFSLGVIAGQSGKPENVVILTKDQDVATAASKLGFKLALDGSNATEKKPRVRRKKITIVTRNNPAPENAAPAPAAKEPEYEQVPVAKKYAAEKKAEGSDVPEDFAKVARECGVADDDMQKVYASVQAAGDAEITYEMQLRLHLLNAGKASEIFDKTKTKFDDLKKASL